MRFGFILLIGIGVLTLLGLHHFFPHTLKNKTFSIAPHTEVLVLKSVYRIDSVILTTCKGELLLSESDVEYVNISEILLILPQEAKELRPSHLKVKGIHPSFPWFQPSTLFFASYFDYFYTYRFRFFIQASLLGGVAFLFFMSLITGFISKIQVLYLYSGLSGFILILFWFLQPNHFIRSIIPFESLSVLFLWLLVLTLNFINQIFIHFSPQKLPAKSPSKQVFFFISSIIAIQLFIELNYIFILMEVALLTLYFSSFYIRVSKFINHYDLHFRVLFISGGILLWENIITVFLIDSLEAAFVSNIALLVYMVVLAYFISEQLLQELKRNVILNEENLELETALGYKAINSVENERKRMAQDLNGDVLKRVYSLSKSLENDNLDLDNISNESKETLDALRNYSYSLYPPYLENLPLENILKREIEKRDIHDKVDLILNFDNTLNVIKHRIFKLWTYRILNEYLNAYFKGDWMSEVLNVQINRLGSDIWVFEILQYTEKSIENPTDINSDTIEIYARYMNADFSLINVEGHFGWRFVSKLSELKG